MRSSGKRLATRLGGLVPLALLTLATPPASANMITPNTLTDDYNGNPSLCSLREAVQASNADTPFDGCPTGSGADEIQLGDGVYQLSRADTGGGNSNGDLEVVSGSDVTVSHAGSGRAAIDGGDLDRVIYIQAGGTLSVSGLTIQNGSVTSQAAGGIANEGTLTLTNVLVTDNEVLTAGYGGGIWSFSGSATLTNVTVSGNRTPVGGGGAAGVYARISATLTNVTISNNTAAGSFGGGLYVGASTTVTLKNSLVAGNSAPGAPDCDNASGGTLTSLDHNLIGNSSGCPFTPQSGDQLDVSAGLAPLADNGGPTSTQAPVPGSNAIDKIPPSDCDSLTTDQRGYPRPSSTSANCDIGAYELITCDGSPLNAPGAFPGCPPVAAATQPTTTTTTTTTPPQANRKKCKRAKKRGTAAKRKRCRKRR